MQPCQPMMSSQPSPPGPSAARGRVARVCRRATSLAVALCSGAAAHPLAAQVDPPPPTDSGQVVVVPGAIYERGGTHRALFGAGYRDLWTTPIEVPVVDLSKLGGGVEPNRLGGGMTTKTLHLDGRDGRRYVFRSVDKSPVEFEDFEGSLLDDIIQDQVSSFHPTGAPVVARLLEAVGILHTDPVFMVVPDDARLAEFHDEFAGMLVLVEERPDDGPDGSPGFAGSTRIASTDDLFDALEESPDQRVDAEELLRARLVDLLVGDRDRSHNNHLWARFEADDGYLWRVIPRDRDQAFVRFDGLFKRLARAYERRLVSFSDVYPDIFALTRNAWDIDRRLLVGLDRATWERTVAEVQAALTDDVIADAVRRMPPEHVAVVGSEMTDALVRRRDRLPEAADAFYRVVFSVPDIRATDAEEELRVTRGGDGLVTVTLTPSDDPGSPTFRRAFSEEETSEIRIYLRGGDDNVVLEGAGAEGILVRVVGGGGEDRFRDESRRPQSQTILYDDDDDTHFPTTGAARVRRSDPDPPYSWFDLDRDLDWGTLTVPQPTASYDADRGLVLAPGLTHDRYGFQKRPFSSRFRVRAGWAFGLNEPLFDLRYLARDVVGAADLRLRFRWSGIEIINFYGFGNETSTTQPKSYHRVAHKQVTTTLAVSIGDGERRYLDVGPTFTYTSTDTATAVSYIAETDPYGAGKFAHAGIGLALGIDTRDHLGTPTRGFRIQGGATVYPRMFDALDSFQEAHAEAAGYLSPGGGNPVLAVRATGKRVWGRYPFTEAAFLGGSSSVRSIREQRYAGDGMLLGSAEIRMKVARMIFPIPSDVGLLVLGDMGRVFLTGDGSTSWHTAVGGGLWFALVNRSNVVRIAAAHGADGTAINAGVGFVF